MASLEDRIAEIVERKITEYLNQAEKDLYTVANQVNDLYFKQVNKMFDTFIQQYYSYITTSYVRHWEQRPGTGKGSNLYYAKDFKIHRGKDPYFEININTARMADDYQHNSAAQVVQNVMNGIRGVPPYWFVPWQGTYNSRYFYYQGEPAKAFDEFMYRLPEMATPVFLRRWRKIRGRKL